jgi:hypothetical protein
MELKQYQIKVLEYMDAYLTELKKQKDEKQNYFDYQQQQGVKDPRHYDKSDYCQLAWDAMKEKFPIDSQTRNLQLTNGQASARIGLRLGFFSKAG